ncbi:MAG TPA: DUF1330 domain-containing protein [Saprospiraceae bacterium]|jgi:uncharacterized protein (DUF1330 family)|nr:DUF1330 domain-containing protein [Saprospiraceae bacterium]
MKSKLFLLTLLLSCALSSRAQTHEGTDEAGPKVFVVLDITVHDSLIYEQYRIQVEPLIQKYGGKYLVRSGGMAFDTNPDVKVVPIEGNWNPNRFIIIEWDSTDELKAFTSAEEYKKVAALREKSATTKSLMVREYLGH